MTGALIDYQAIAFAGSGRYFGLVAWALLPWTLCGLHNKQPDRRDLLRCRL